MEKLPFKRDNKLPCRLCKRVTYHWVFKRDVEFEYQDNEAVQQEENSIKEVFERLECCGCGTKLSKEYRLRIEETTPIEYDVKIYPDYEDWHLDSNELLLSNLPKDTALSYQEVITDYNSKSNRSCGIMIRSVLESLGSDIKKKLIEDGENPSNIKLDIIVRGLKDKNLITPKLADILYGLKFLGDEPAHQLKASTTEELRAAILIMEHILENFAIEGYYNEFVEKIRPKSRRA